MVCGACSTKNEVDKDHMNILNIIKHHADVLWTSQTSDILAHAIKKHRYDRACHCNWCKETTRLIDCKKSRSHHMRKAMVGIEQEGGVDLYDLIDCADDHIKELKTSRKKIKNLDA